jgi:hypothetical protein
MEESKDESLSSLPYLKKIGARSHDCGLHRPVATRHPGGDPK